MKTLSRRRCLARSSAAAAVAITAPFVARLAHALPEVAKGNNIFSLGVASGDPLPDGVVLWTRLAPQPLEENGGMPKKVVEVAWEIAEDERFQNVVQKGTVIADPAWGHSMHVDVRGLKPARWYWYRFRFGNQMSAVGRTRTAPPVGTPLDRLRFAFASCQKYEDGYYTAYQHMAKEDLDLVFFLGDYIYEKDAKWGKPRGHDLELAETLGQYRQRYGLYKSDSLLQAAHEAVPWIVTWDDHEFTNDYANDIDTPNLEQSPEVLQRRANAYKAYYEHMPLRSAQRPKGPHMQLYRRFAFGDLAAFNVLDTRQYRTRQPCDNENRPLCDEVFDPKATMLGKAQEGWLFGGLMASKARWNVLAQQIPFMQRNNRKRGVDRFKMDKWDGYRVPRKRLLQFLDEKKIANPVVITGDAHENCIGELKTDFDDPSSKTVGCELITTSIASRGDGRDMTGKGRRLLKHNDHIKFYNRYRGYIRCDVTPQEWRADLRTVAVISKPGAPIKTRASFVIEAGKPGLKKVTG